MPYRVLISEELAPEGLAILRAEKDIEVVERPPLKGPELAKEIGDYDALIVRSGAKVTAEVIAAGTKLKVIGRAGIPSAGVTSVRAKLTVRSTRGGTVLVLPTGKPGHPTTTTSGAGRPAPLGSRELS